jgi:hypothetical protein
MKRQDPRQSVGVTADEVVALEGIDQKSLAFAVLDRQRRIGAEAVDLSNSNAGQYVGGKDCKLQ